MASAVMIGDDYPAVMLSRQRATYQRIITNLFSATQKQEAIYNRKATPQIIQVGLKGFAEKGRVAEGLSKKLAPKYYGPLRVLEIRGPVTAKVSSIFPKNAQDAKPFKIHFNKLEAAPDRLRPDGQLPSGSDKE